MTIIGTETILWIDTEIITYFNKEKFVLYHINCLLKFDLGRKPQKFVIFTALPDSGRLNPIPLDPAPTD